MLSLATPIWLLALPLPWLMWWWLRRRPRQEAPALLHPQAQLLAELAREQPLRTPWLWGLGCSLLILALAHPCWHEQRYQSRNLMLLVDDSASMHAVDAVMDGKPISRLEMLKRVVDGFLAGRQGDRAGLIIFGDDAYTLAPLTHDLKLVRHFLSRLEQGIAGDRTAIGRAIALGVKRLQQEDPASRVLILLTDGSQSAGDITPDQALALARHSDVRIYTVGIGRQGLVEFPRGPVAAPEYTEVPLDEALLQRLAQSSGGRYYAADDPKSLARVIADIGQLETVAAPRQGTPVADPTYLAPLLAALGLLGLALVRGRKAVLP